MELLRNPFRKVGLPVNTGLAPGDVSTDPATAAALLQCCPAYAPTPLRRMPDLAHRFGVATLLLKDESSRMGLGSFKALGAAYAIARHAAARLDASGYPATDRPVAEALADTVYACASAGNHGLSVAAGARVFGATAVIYLADSVPETFAGRLRRLGARVVRPGGDYEDAMAAAAADADANGWVLLSDSSWPGYTELPRQVMEGYLVMAAEVTGELSAPPTHVFLQAGVGGLAAAVTALVRARWGAEPVIIVVEPDAAPALIDSIRAGRPVTTSGPVSSMGRLDCKTPSHLALAELARNADFFMTLGEEEAATTVALLERHGVGTTPSGAAGVAGLHHAGGHRTNLALSPQSRVLAFISEGREDAA